MFDLRSIRENPEFFRDRWNRRTDQLGDIVDKIISLDTQVREAVTIKQSAETDRNANSKLIGKAKAEGNEDEFIRLRDNVAQAKKEIESAEKQENAAREQLDSILLGLPNIPLDDVPLGEDEASNIEVSRWGQPREFSFTPKPHDEIGVTLGLMDFETAAKISGARFVILSGELARLERAIVSLMLDIQTVEHGYVETSPPYLVRDSSLVGTGQLPTKFADDLFKTGHGPYLIPTAEVPLTNLVRECIVDSDYLPRRYVAHTPCFRGEAGAAGRDTKGMIRLHQFHKVELVSIVANEQEGLRELERKTRCAEVILERLELPYRKVILSTGDMGAGARKTYDLEVWLPSQQLYREISSCSYCGDYQARRMNARYRPEPKAKPEYVHTLNGSGLAVGRTLVAIIENYQNVDGSIEIPNALRQYLGGTEKIG